MNLASRLRATADRLRYDSTDTSLQQTGWWCAINAADELDTEMGYEPFKGPTFLALRDFELDAKVTFNMPIHPARQEVRWMLLHFLAEMADTGDFPQ